MMDVICVAENSKLPVWNYSSFAITERIEADSYRVIVPNSDVEGFTLASPPQFHVEAEDCYSADFGSYLKDSMSGENAGRYGWYLQQLIKLEALRTLANQGKTGLIWDADTMPLRQMCFVSEGGRCSLFHGEEYHAPYFEAISRLLGMNRVVAHSFVAQSFLCRPEWILDFCDEIERKNGVPWWQAVIDCIDFKERSGFSEYETLGTFISHRFPDGWSWSPGEWARNGYSLFGTPQNAYKLSQEGNVDLLFAAFEHWESSQKRTQGGFIAWLRRIKNRIKRVGRLTA